MASQEPAVNDNALNAEIASPAQKNNGTVVKRNRRGYHKFRSGILNVTPKGAERQLVQTNQQSPLLSLPPEIRHTIWGLVLGGRMLRHVSGKFFGSVPGNDIDISLLRVCRQIYSEAALIPFRQNVFSFQSDCKAKCCYRFLKKHLFNHITTIHLELVVDYLLHLKVVLNHLYDRVCDMLSNKLPTRLRVVIARIFAHPSLHQAIAIEGDSYVRQAVRATIPARQIDLQVEVSTIAWRDFDLPYCGSRANPAYRVAAE